MNSPSGGHTAALSPDAVLTSIDAVLWERYGRVRQPGDISATDSFFFNTGPTVGIGFIWDEDTNVGDFEEIEEQEEFLKTDPFIGNQKTIQSKKFYKQVPISDEAFRADLVGKRDKIGKQVGDKARQTQDKRALLDTYADAFAGSVNTTPDGQALYSNAHVALKYGTSVDNLETGSLTPDNLWTNVNALANQKGQDGDAGSHVFEGFLSNFNNYRAAKEIMNSALVANSGENNINIFDTVYGQVRIAASIFLNTAYNSATNAATSYHVLSADHQVMRKTFYGLTTHMKTPEVTNNDSYAYVAKFNEVCFPGSWTGAQGRDGSV